MEIAGKLQPEARAGSAVTDIVLTDGYRLQADIIASDATGRPLLADKDQLAEGGNALMMTGKVATVKQPVARLEVSSDSGISACPKRGTKSMGSPLRVCQVWLFLLIILASSKQVLSSADSSCRFDLTSVATLSCVEPDGNLRPPSVSCCKALLYAIDYLPARNESGACCLCLYLSKKYTSHALALATSYVLCQGKDSHIVTAWSSLPLPCYKACRQGSASSYGMGTPILKDFPVGDVEGTQGGSFKMMPWIAIICAAAFCVMFLIGFCYYWRHRPVPLNLQNQGQTSEIRVERRPSGKKSSAHRRMSSSRGSPNG